MRRGELALLTALAMLAFAANSLLCRVALREGHIDPASFTLIRIASGALALCLLLAWRGELRLRGSWISALVLFAYAAGFSYAYLTLAAGTGALLLFGAVQATMIGAGLLRGERFDTTRLAGLLLAGAGLVVLTAPGLSAPHPVGSLLMAGAGIAWGVYSLHGRGAIDASADTAGNFLRACTPALILAVAAPPSAWPDSMGIACAVASGALASGLGYAVWYRVLPSLRSTSAATVQLSVPVLAAAGATLFLGESITLRLLIASAMVLGGIALVIVRRQPQNRQSH
jgi:drug/metabolite transporter (DMT)-like permease